MDQRWSLEIKTLFQYWPTGIGSSLFMFWFESHFKAIWAWCTLWIILCQMYRHKPQRVNLGAYNSNKSVQWAHFGRYIEKKNGILEQELSIWQLHNDPSKSTFSSLYWNLYIPWWGIIQLNYQNLFSYYRTRFLA